MVNNPQYGTDVLNYILELSASGDKKALKFVSGNCYWVPLSRIKTIAEKRRSATFIGLSHNETIDLLIELISRIHTVRKDPKSRVDLTAGINKNTLVKEYQVSTSDNAVFGGASLIDFIPVGGSSKEQIFECYKECIKGKKVQWQQRSKLLLFILKHTPKVMPQFFTVAGRPQTTNEQNKFSLMVVESC